MGVPAVMEISAFERYQDAALSEISDITRRVERGELSVADGEAKIIPIFQGLERAKAAVVAAREKKARAMFSGLQRASVCCGVVMMLWVAMALVESYLLGHPIFHASRMDIEGDWAVLWMVAIGTGGAFMAGMGLSKLRSMKSEPPNNSLKRTDQSLRD